MTDPYRRPPARVSASMTARRLGLVDRSGRGERRAAGEVRLVDVGAGADQQLDDAGLAVARAAETAASRRRRWRG